jgi:hypothetical protein
LKSTGIAPVQPRYCPGAPPGAAPVQHQHTSLVSAPAQPRNITGNTRVLSQGTPGTAPVQDRWGPGTIPEHRPSTAVVQFADVSQVELRYSTGASPVQHQYSPGTPPVQHHFPYTSPLQCRHGPGKAPGVSDTTFLYFMCKCLARSFSSPTPAFVLCIHWPRFPAGSHFGSVLQCLPQWRV